MKTTYGGNKLLVARARAGRLRSSEMAGGTITVSALGERGAETMAGIILLFQLKKLPYKTNTIIINSLKIFLIKI
ncbi:2-oxo acid dehydrogenase subunit E2 [Mangrovicoccus ximenensis]|uniref:2-oxo acid dehydrogenase subunit E2 n=1 Tax=Mangrovicoccus ximenensis TaxID=1911570 RepID=UPI001F01AC34|nr:2-oxo acid dehydrogenase subunit E2 [Mangrovicoccus ximenensis]